VEDLRKEGHAVSSVHLRYLNPLPKDLKEILGRFDTVVVPELNLGQLSLLLRARYLVDVQSINKVHGHPFKVSEIIAGVRRYLAPKGSVSWPENRQAHH
jgi:2-oxoglutarate ferredoxin oxidoreductase subunit alpha